MALHNLIGQEGEQAACDYLIGKGYTVRKTNWRLGHLEIDIVAHERDANVLHIVEVKTRSGDVDHHDPMEAITPKKIRNLVNAANGYLGAFDLKMAVQYDVMIITGTAPDFHIQLIEDAFQPPLRTIR